MNGYITSLRMEQDHHDVALLGSTVQRTVVGKRRVTLEVVVELDDADGDELREISSSHKVVVRPFYESDKPLAKAGKTLVIGAPAYPDKPTTSSQSAW